MCGERAKLCRTRQAVEKEGLAVETEGLAVEKKDSGKSVVAGMLDMLIGDVVKIVDLKSPVMTEDESEESNVKEDNLWNDTEHGLTSSGDEDGLNGDKACQVLI